MASVFIIILIIIGGAVWGFHQGSLKMFWALGSIIVGIVLGTILNPLLTNFMNEQIHLSMYVGRAVDNQLSLSDTEQSDLDSKGIDSQNAYIKNLQIPSTWKKSIRRDNSEAGREAIGADSFTEYVTAKIAQMSVKTISFLMTFALINILLAAFAAASGMFENVQLDSDASRMGGLFLGIIWGDLVIALIMVIIAFVKIYSWGDYIFEVVYRNGFTYFLFQHNLIFWILSSAF